MSPEIHDIVDDNLAADFDGSLSGLGVDIHAASFSMSEALNALPNLSISSSQIFKQEVPSPNHHFNQLNQPVVGGCYEDQLKNEPVSRASTSRSDEDKKNYGALDLSNDEAHLPDTNEDHRPQTEESLLPVVTSFAGSVSRESTPSMNNFSQHHAVNKMKAKDNTSPSSYGVSANLSASNPNLSSGNEVNAAAVKSHKVILPLQQSKDTLKLEKRSYETIAMGELETSGNSCTNANNFQYILAASTSIATKLNEPSITYLNQGQPYELRMKKLGDLSPYRKRLLKCVLRICFHERRLQYMETEQIAEWSSKHPGERIIDLDLPLSYGVFEPVRDQKSINTLAFKWDPTRDTGIYIKVNCISTEFTPKKHGGEKGVPFRLQVETYDNESRIHAAGCILQVFKLKGADRKHKQDRDKISKRPLAEQEKYSPSFESTVLADLPLEHIFVPANLSRSGTPIHVVDSTPNIGPTSHGSTTVTNDVVVSAVSNQIQNNNSTPVQRVDSDNANNGLSNSEDALHHHAIVSASTINPNDFENTAMEASASVSQVAVWLMANRFSSHLSIFCNYCGRDMLRLTREELIVLCGTSDGIRLYNSLHLVPILPKATFYVGAKDGDNEFSALFLEELTNAELMRRLGEAFNIDVGLFSKGFFVGPKGILVRMSDRVVKNFKADTVFQFSLRSPPQSEVAGGYEVVFEEIATVQLNDSSNSPSIRNSK